MMDNKAISLWAFIIQTLGSWVAWTIVRKWYDLRGNWVGICDSLFVCATILKFHFFNP